MDGKLKRQQGPLSLALATLGIVYGDIGTSPLYAMKVSLGNLPINIPDILGILSLIFWSLIIIISIKYLCLIFRADNNGEGGILALLALLKSTRKRPYHFLSLLGIVGAGLMLGDGMLTPAISVVSAVEGLDLISPVFSHWVLPLTSIILIALFMLQHRGTAKIGSAFGPIILLWFILLAILGIRQIIGNPIVLYGMNPIYGIRFLFEHGWQGYALLGGIFLVVTGGEALYSDIGHFGKQSIRVSWFWVALPALVLNYFGQGAHLIAHPAAISNPFYSIAPTWFTLPLIIIATMATIIASQAVISATFSLTKQAVLLGFYPPLPIIQTSAAKEGQIYVPQLNLFLAIGTLVLIAIFKSSDAIAHAYGIAVNLVMLITTTMIIAVAYKKWQWSILKIALVFSVFVLFDLAFLGANLEKIITGGWVPILFSIVIATIMLTWNPGMESLKKEYYIKKDTLLKHLNQIPYRKLIKIPKVTTAFIVDIYDKSGGGLINFLKLSHTLPENIILITYTVDPIPYVKPGERITFELLEHNIYQMTLHYGFMDTISIPKALQLAEKQQLLPFTIDVDSLTYFVEIPNVLASHRKGTLPFYWQEKLFSYLMRNYSPNLNIEFYQLPPHKTISIGSYYVI